jgi:hypothetical protein
MEVLYMSNLILNDNVIGGSSNDSSDILYTPNDNRAETNVQDELDKINTELDDKADKSYVEANDLGTPVDIPSSYQAPCDGYVQVTGGGAYIYGKSGSGVRFLINSVSTGTYISVYIRKGMQILRQGGTCTFYPLV